MLLYYLYYLKIDLQWMVLTCDPMRDERETCKELPVRFTYQQDLTVLQDLTSVIYVTVENHRSRFA